MTHFCSRRKFLGAMGATAGMLMARPYSLFADAAPVGRVAVGVCHQYGLGVTSTLSTMFDQLGGLGKLVGGKTVAIKLNLTGVSYDRVAHFRQEDTYWVHPNVVGATIRLMAKAGARRVRLLESPMGSAEPLQEFMLASGWEPRDFENLGTKVEFENTNYLGYGKKYARFMVPGNALMYKGYDLNHSYEDCDVYVSLAKLKEHFTAGVTLSMKNCFGSTPCTIYGDGSPVDEPGLVPKGGRGPFHQGYREPSKSAPQMINPNGPKDPGYRVPRVVADLVAARPVHLAIIDGIQTISGGEGPWIPHCKVVKPGLLVAGTNCVSTDAVAMALMGFDPTANRGKAPFETSDNTLALAEGLGVGSRDLKRIEVVGTPIEKGRFNFRQA